MRFFFLLLVLWVTHSEAAIRLPSILADHMVLQQNSNVKLWGWSNPSEIVTIIPSWDGHAYETTADNGGKWMLNLTTPSAGGPYSISFKASNEVVLNDVLIGEVWICSGQSNMEWSARHGFDNAEKEVREANYPSIRFFNIPKTTSDHPQDDCEGTWEACTPESFSTFSAVGYFFGRELQAKLDVPIGLIEAAWGGTAAEVWTPNVTIEKDVDFSNWQAVLAKSDWWPRRPGVVYNAMIHPISQFKVSGAIWYQGESNTGNAEVYKRLFPAMIESWREAWDFPMPFYYVQIAPYNYGKPLIGAHLREAQLQSMTVPRSGMVVISDIGNNYDIHPGNKMDVGKRLANWALSKTYGIPDIPYSGPIFKSYSVEDGTMIIKFEHAENGLLADGPLTNFELAGEEKIFLPASAEIRGSEVWVTSEYVLEPIACRYGFKNMVEPHLKNQHGLPASTFRTDNWSINVFPVDIQIEYKPEAEAYLVTLLGDDGIDQIKYTTNGDPAGLFGLTYRDPFYIEKECTIQAIGFAGGVASDHAITKEVKLNIATFKPATYAGGSYHASRTAGGQQALIDGKKGSNNPNDGHWQGFKENDLEFIIDFGKRVEISSIKLNALKSQKQNIFLPNKVTFEISNDGARFVEIFRRPLFHARENEVSIMPYEFSFKNSRKTRYVRVKAENVGECPSWHTDAGASAWLMIDEIVIE